MAGSNLNFNIPRETGGGGGGVSSPGDFPLTRQSSIYSLTFDEFQNTVGSIGKKDFGSMNMDELLRNIWSAEENQNTGSTNNDANFVGQEEGIGYLLRQGSLTLPRTLSHKTVDQVWRDIVNDYGGENDPTFAAAGFSGMVPQQHRQPTLGEVTLEEFLVRAGVVKEESQSGQKGTNVNFFGTANDFVGYDDDQIAAMRSGGNSAVRQVYPHQQQQRLLAKLPISEGPGVSSDGLTKSNDDTPSGSPVTYVFNGGGGGGGALRGRKSPAFEKVVERRQRRMIKNRESAAKSRARKQAYTDDLEAEVVKLKAENKLLQKQQAEMLEMQKNQVVEMMTPQNGKRRRCLRRTQTSPW